MNNLNVMNIIKSAIEKIADDKNFNKFFRNGVLHNDNIVRSLIPLVLEAGLDARQVHVEGSNYPLWTDKERHFSPRPDDYKYTNKLFMQFGGMFARMEVVSNVKTVECYESIEKIAELSAYKGYVTCHEVGVDNSEDPHPLSAEITRNAINADAFIASLSACLLDAGTAHHPESRPRPRL